MVVVLGPSAGIPGGLTEIQVARPNLEVLIQQFWGRASEFAFLVGVEQERCFCWSGDISLRTIVLEPLPAAQAGTSIHAFWYAHPNR